MAAKQPNEVKKQIDDLFKLLLQKTQTSYKSLIESSRRDFIVSNLEVLTQTEKQRFDKLVF
ncbi:MAG: hypothetical protein LBN95_10655 [Prevotellaceae bacterium]|jgi:hypothetical protein|nr:hypothetical protein [Prevotellaceae bacterium]